MEVANIILSQLGGRCFLAMTDTKHLIAHENALSFHIPSNFARHGINRVRIDLTPQDLYNVTFSRVRGLKVLYQSSIEDVDCDQLRSVFTETTGLSLSLRSGSASLPPL